MALTVNQAVKRSGISRSTLYRAMASGGLVARKYGKRTLILTQDLDKWLHNLPLAPVQLASS
ncbi:MAG: helix-turn-helix domain-containing protein [Ferrovibrio sp.]|nr:helix-turn-helix domain-containing protein [Ferrovibrio sp.]